MHSLLCFLPLSLPLFHHPFNPLHPAPYPLHHNRIRRFPHRYSILFTSIVLLLFINDHCTCGKLQLDRDLFFFTFLFILAKRIIKYGEEGNG